MEVKEKVNNVTITEKDPIYSIEDLKNNIDILICHERRNSKLINTLGLNFVEKGLDITIPKRLFLNSLEVKDLNEIELITLDIGIWDFFKENKNKRELEYINNLYPRNYFYSAKLSQVMLMQPEEKQVDEWVRLKKVERINEKEYQLYMDNNTLEYIYDNRKYEYKKDIQRASKIITTPNGEVILKENYNKDGMKDLENRFLKEDVLTTQISFTLLKLKGKEGEFEFIPKYENIGDFNFKPIFDMDKNNYFPLCLNDGAHRFLSKISAIKKAKKEGKQLKNGLSVMIRILNIPEAKQLASDSFKQNATDKMYRSTLDNTIENQFVNNYIDSSYYYKNKIARSTQEEKTEAFWGSFSNMKESIKLLPELDLKNEAKSLLIANDMGKCTKVIIDYLIGDKYNNDIVEFEKSIFTKKNMSIGWLIISYRLRTYDKVDMISLAEKVYNKQNEYKKVLEKKDYKETFNYFENLINKEIGEENV